MMLRPFGVAVLKGAGSGSGAEPVGEKLLTNNRLSEFAADPQAQADAQANLGLGATNFVTYYIQAKA